MSAVRIAKLSLIKQFRTVTSVSSVAERPDSPAKTGEWRNWVASRPWMSQVHIVQHAHAVDLLVPPIYLSVYVITASPCSNQEHRSQPQNVVPGVSAALQRSWG